MSTVKEELIGDNGSSLVEILIALAIFSLTLSATMVVFFGGQNFLEASLESRKAIEKAHDGIEALRFIRDADWTKLTNGMHGLSFDAGKWQLIDSPDWNEGYKRTASISTDFDGLKHIKLTVQWSPGTEGTKSIELYQILSPLEQGISGDWGQPCRLSGASGDGGSKGTNVFYADGKAYVTSSTKSGFYIFDVTDTSNPTLMGKLDVGEGLKAVTVSGNYAYAVAQNSNTLYVIDATDPAIPARIATLPLTDGGNGLFLMVRGNYVFATTAVSATGPEFFVIDISTPSSPTIATTLEIGGSVNAISVLQNTAYLATSLNDKELDLIDVSNPLAPAEIGSYDAIGDADGLSAHAKTKKRIYLGRAESTNNEFVILDASDPSMINLRGSTDTGGNVYSLFSIDTLSFAGTAIPNEEFQDYYVRDPTAPVKNGSMNLSNIGTGTDYHNNIVFMSVKDQNILQLITSVKEGNCDD